MNRLPALSLINLMVSVDVKHIVYLLTLFEDCRGIMVDVIK